MRVRAALLLGFLGLAGVGDFYSLSSPAVAEPGSLTEVGAMNHEHDSPQQRTQNDPTAVSQAAKDLRDYYQHETKEPAWQDAIQHLSAPEATRRAQAASYLRDLLDQALKDELAGVDPRQPTPFWGQGPMSKARVLRQSVAAALAKAEPTPGVIPVVRWFLDHEKLTTLQGEALKVVIRLQGAEADALLLELATKPHPNAEVTLTALMQVGERKLKVTGAQLAALCQHHRSKLREAARALNAKLGFPVPPPFDPVRAIQSEPIHRLMDEIGRLLDQPVPTDAPFVRLTITYRADDTGDSRKWLESEPTTVRGWLLSEDRDSWLLLTPHGWRNSYRKTGQPNATIALARVPIDEEVARVAALRRQRDEKFELSSRGGFSGQFEGHVAGEYEALLAQWLYAGKRYELAAAILLPALDTLLLDSHLADITRDRLGNVYGYQMLAAFVGDRDYAKTERLAKWMTERFPGTSLFLDAIRLLDELPRRRGDFKTLRLPTPAEWAAQKKTMSRREQIDYLCRRLRLLNCFQESQPGGPMYDGPQYAEPCGITADAAHGLYQGKTELINPLTELVGELYAGQRAPRSEGLRVTVDDIPALAEHLREDWYQLTVSYWRDFAPGRTLERTRSLLVFIINRIAGHTLCDAAKLNTMSPKRLEGEIARLSRWAEENRGKDETALLLKHLEDALKAGTPWFQLNHQVARLAELKAKAAVPLLFRFVEEGRVEPREISEIRRWCDNIAPGALREVARKALEHADDNVRKLIALLDLDKDEAALLLADLERSLKSQDPFPYYATHHFERLAKLKVKAAVPLFFRFVEAGRLQHFELNSIGQECARLDPGVFQELTRKGLTSNDEKIRMRVALLALQTSDREKAITVLGDGLERGTVLLAETFSALLYYHHFNGDRAALAGTAVRVFKNPLLLTIDHNERYRIAYEAAGAGIADGLRIYLRLMETPGNTVEGKTYDRPVAEVTADDLILKFAQHDHAVALIQKKSAAPPEKITALKEWLKKKIQAVEAKK